METDQLDIIQLVRNVESPRDKYAAIGLVLPDGKGIALGIFQAIPKTWKGLLGESNLTQDQKNILDQAVAASHAAYTHKTTTAKEARTKFKNKWAVVNPTTGKPNVPNITTAFPESVQNKAQIQYILDIVYRLGGDEIDYRDVIHCNHNGKLLGNKWWTTIGNIDKNQVKPPLPRETAATYLSRAGVPKPRRAGYVRKTDLIDYLKNYYDADGNPVPGANTIEVRYSGSDMPLPDYSVNYSDSIENSDTGVLGTKHESGPLKSTVVLAPRPGDTVIGDVRLTIPPTSIQLYHQNQVYTVDAVRMAGNPKILNQSPVSGISMTVFFNGATEINTKLRPLIAQYRQTPFTTVQNETVFMAFLDIMKKEELLPEDIEDEAFDPTSPLPVVLDSISLNTVPGYPDLIQAHITLNLFNHKPFVPEMRFWALTKDALIDSVYGVYRNSYGHIQKDITKDSALLVQDQEGSDISVEGNDSGQPGKSTPYPAESWSYKKAYSSVLMDPGMIPGKDYYASSVDVPTLSVYTRDQGLNLKYYSTRNITMRKLRLERAVEGMIDVLGSIDNIRIIAELNRGDFADSSVRLGTFEKLAGAIDTVRSMFALFSELRGTALRFAELNLNHNDVGDILDKYVYVKKPRIAGQDGLQNIGTFRVEDVVADMISGMKEYNDKAEDADFDIAKGALDVIMARALVEVTSGLESISDNRNITPTHLNLFWREAVSDPSEEMSNHTVIAQDVDAVNTWAALTGISMSFRNKMVPVPVHGYRLPAYQHLGGGEWSISLNIKTADESLITYLEDIQSSSGHIMQSQLNKEMGLSTITHRLEVMNSGSLLAAMGVGFTVLKGIDVSNVDGHPGWYNINVELVQDDVTLDSSHQIRAADSLSTGMMKSLSDCLFPFPYEDYAATEDTLYSEILRLYPGVIDTSVGSQVATRGGVMSSLVDWAAEFFKDGEVNLSDIMNVSTGGMAYYSEKPFFYQSMDMSGDNAFSFVTKNVFTGRDVNYVSVFDTYKKKFNTELKLPFPVFYDDDWKENTALGMVFYQSFLKPVTVAMISALDIVMGIDSYSNLDILNVYGMYEKYLTLCKDYVVQWAQYDISYHMGNLKNTRNGESSEGNRFSMQDTLIHRKRYSLSTQMLVRGVLGEFINKYGNESGFPDIILDAHNAYQESLKTSQQHILDNYPDFNYPVVSLGSEHIRAIGPAFPYVDYHNDTTFEDESALVEQFVNTASFTFAAISGKITSDRLNDEETNDIKTFLEDLRTKAGSSKEPLIRDPNLIPTWAEVERTIDVLKPYMNPDNHSSEEKATRLRATRSDILRYLKIEAILKYYTLTEAFGPTGESVVVDITFPQKDGKFDYSRVKAHYKLKGKDEVIPYDKLVERVLSKSTTRSDKNNLDQNVEDSIRVATHETEQLLNSIYEAKMSMINICNAEDPEAFTSFLGFSDVDAYAKRKELHAACVGAKSRNYLGSMYRAFPTMKIFFMEEDNSEWLLFDDVYNYNALLSCDIVDSKHAASQTAIIKLSNLAGRLSTPSYQGTIDHDTPYGFKSTMLRVGAKVMIKGGYGPDHRTLPILFQGAVTELSPGEIMELTCQSWGVELTNPVSTSTEGVSFGSTSPEKSMGAAALRILSSAHGLKHFGRWSPAILSTDDYKVSTLDMERAWWLSSLPVFDFVGDAIGGDHGASLNQFLRSIGTAATNFESSLVNWGNPLYDNIYLNVIQENGYSFAKLATGGISNAFSSNGTFSWKIYNQSIWDALWEMARFHGDYIVRPLPYNENSLEKGMAPRMTLYVGPRTGVYKYADSNNFRPKKSLELKPSVIDMLLTDESGNTGSLYGSAALREFRRHTANKIVFLANASNNLEDSTNSLWRKLATNQQKEVMVRVLHAMHSEGYETLAARMIQFMEANPRFESVFGTRLDSLWDSVLTITSRKDTDTAIQFAEFMFDPISYLAKKANTRYVSEILVNMHSYQSYIDLADAVSKHYRDDYYAVHSSGDLTYATTPFFDLLRIAYEMNEILIADMTNIIAKPATANYIPAARDYVTARDWMTQESKLFGAIFESAREGGLIEDNYRSVVEHHFVDSYRHIIDNQIIATADHMYNKVEVVYPNEPTILPMEVWKSEDDDNKVYRASSMLNPYLDPNYIRTYTSVQKNLRMKWGLDWFHGKRFVSDNLEYDARNAVPLYKEVCNQILLNMAKPMYQGTLTVVGAPNIRPWHVVHLYDSVNQMHGPIEVEQVVHSYNPQSGFTTTITPNAVITNRSLQEVWDTQYLDVFGAIDSWRANLSLGLNLSGSLLLSGIGIWKRAALSAGVGMLNSIGGIAATAGKVAGPLALLGTSLKLFKDGLQSYTRITYTGAMARASFLAGWSPLVIVPLIYRSKPYLAGLEGAYWGDDVYSFVLGQLRNRPEEFALSMMPSILAPFKELEEVE